MLVTDDSRDRRAMYQRLAVSRREEEAFLGPRVDYLRTLGMVLTIAPAAEADLDRAAELTVRTHQLNTTEVFATRAARRHPTPHRVWPINGQTLRPRRRDPAMPSRGRPERCPFS